MWRDDNPILRHGMKWDAYKKIREMNLRKQREEKERQEQEEKGKEEAKK